MGCDIHAFIEVETLDNRGKIKWVDSAAQVFPGRNYEMFCCLSGLRGNHNPIFEPRGFPAELGHRTVNEFCLWNVGMMDEAVLEWNENICSDEQFEEYLKDGCQKYNENHIFRPYWHSASYLYTKEMEKVLNDYKKRVGNDEIDNNYVSILSMMKALEKNRDKIRSRFVFCFDS